jgi:hypothetical protein
VIPSIVAIAFPLKLLPTPFGSVFAFRLKPVAFNLPHILRL